MGYSVNCVQKIFEYKLKRSSACGLLFALALIIAFWGAIDVPDGRAQEPILGSNSANFSQGSSVIGSDDQGTCQGNNDDAGDQATCQNDNADGLEQAPSTAGNSNQEACQGGDSECSTQMPPVPDSGNQGTDQRIDVEGATQGTTQRGSPVPSSVQDRDIQTRQQNRNIKSTIPPSGSKTKIVEDNRGEPKQIPQPIPYGDMPSLRDLYTEIPSTGGALKRFGSDSFLIGTGNANELPMDLPAGPDYVLGPGDTLAVNMWGGQSGRLNRIIDRQGQIDLPEAGTIMIDGMTIAGAQDAIQRALATQFQDEHVEISLERLRTVRIYVVGDVQRPGAYDVSSLSTPLSALYAAGGPTNRGSLRILKQFRGNQLVREIDLYDFLLKGVRSNSDRLLPGDTILVPPVGPLISIEGMVNRPAIYELNGEQTLNQVLDLAGGVLPTASLKQINVERVVAHESRTMLSLKIPDSEENVEQKLANFHVQGGDDIVIARILPYNEQAIYLEGHVYRPGKYPYKEGMTISDLLHSYQDVLPEPADHAELVRLMPPDFRPETVSFSLHDALMGNSSFLLEPFDLVRIFGRYEIDPPKVSIEGEVLRPGEYPMSQGLTVAGLVGMAGGFKRSAYRDEAGLSSYIIQNGQKVLTNRRNVEIADVLNGNKNADVVLKPGDVVSIWSLAGWQDIGASIKISGEVERAGSYGIEDGEHLSSVLKRAGGFREDAYPLAAVLERSQVRQLGEQARQEMIQRIEDTPIEIKPGTMSEQAAAAMQQSLEQERRHALALLRGHPASGRLVINISSDISKWENTPADIEVRAGDTLFIPKKPNFVMVSGQVYNPVGITYVPGRDLDWYLKKAGGATSTGDKKHIYVLRADGSVVVPKGGESVWTSDKFRNVRMRPGDTIFVPEKIIGGSPVWQNIIGVAQIMSAMTVPLAIGGVI